MPAPPPSSSAHSRLPLDTDSEPLQLKGLTQPPVEEPSWLTRAQFRTLMAVTSGRFSLGLMIMIVGNTVVLAMEHYDETPSFNVCS